MITGGISNPLEVIAQITSLLFIRRLDDLHTFEENKADRLKQPMERSASSVCRAEWKLCGSQSDARVLRTATGSSVGKGVVTQLGIFQRASIGTFAARLTSKTAMRPNLRSAFYVAPRALKQAQKRFGSRRSFAFRDGQSPCP